MRSVRSQPADDPEDVAAAESAALRILGGASQSAHSLQQRLVRRGYSRDAAAEAVRRCRDLGYIDDAALAESVAARHARSGHGAARALQDLQRRGISREVIAGAVQPMAEDESAAVLDVAERLLDRERRRGDVDDAGWRRLGSSLQRRGFSSSAIRSALRQLALRSEDSSAER